MMNFLNEIGTKNPVKYSRYLFGKNMAFVPLNYLYTKIKNGRRLSKS